MFARIAMLGVLAMLGLVASADPAGACGKRSVPTPVYYPCPCDPCHHHWPVYVVSPPSVPLYGKDTQPIPTRVVPFGKGVIVEFTVASGTPAPTEGMPTGVIQVIKTGGPGEIEYEGYNVRPPVPGMPGSPTVYSVFLLPKKAGRAEVKVGFVTDKNEIVNHALSFDIVNVVY